VLSRLSTAAEDIDQALARVSAEVSSRCAQAAALFALDAVGLRDESSKSAAELDALAESYDNEYFSIQDEIESGQRDDDDESGDIAFSKARAVSALAFAKRGEPDEAIYEAIMSFDDGQEVRDLVLANLNAS
jgi:hypothetical protein